MGFSYNISPLILIMRKQVKDKNVMCLFVMNLYLSYFQDEGDKQRSNGHFTFISCINPTA